MAQRLLRGQSLQVNPCRDGSPVDARFLRPVGKGERPPECGNPSDRATISRLFLSRCPTHVPGFVVATGINPVECVIGRRCWADMRQEALERALPSSAYSDPSSTIAMIVLLGGIAAPPDHPHPCPVFLRRAPSLRMPMRRESASRGFSCPFPLETSAAAGRLTSGDQTVPPDRTDRTAYALASEPGADAGMAPLTTTAPEYAPATKSSPSLNGSGIHISECNTHGGHYRCR